MKLNIGKALKIDTSFLGTMNLDNCDSNIQKLELEKIADTALMVAKKHYAMSECFKEPNIFINTGDKIIYAGLELIQRSTPPFARKCQAEFTNGGVER